MIVTNPTSSPIEIQFKGTKYFVEAESDLAGVQEDAASYWQEHIHNFVKVSPEKVREVPTAPKKVEAPVEAPKVETPAAPVAKGAATPTKTK